MKNKIKNETIIELCYKGYHFATEKRIVYEDREVKSKYLNPKTGKWVKYSTFNKVSTLNDDLMYLVKAWYYKNLHKPLFYYYGKVKVELAIRHPEDSFGVVLGPWDKLITRVEVDPWSIADITVRDEHHLVIETRYDKDSGKDDIDYTIETLELILKNLKAKKEENE